MIRNARRGNDKTVTANPAAQIAGGAGGYGFDLPPGGDNLVRFILIWQNKKPPLFDGEAKVERKTGVEPATFGLGSRRSTN